jgi:hypothetical protein
MSIVRLGRPQRRASDVVGPDVVGSVSQLAAVGIEFLHRDSQAGRDGQVGSITREMKRIKVTKGSLRPQGSGLACLAASTQNRQDGGPSERDITTRVTDARPHTMYRTIGTRLKVLLRFSHRMVLRFAPCRPEFN